MSQLDRQAWNEAVVRTPGGSFLQSWEWGEFQEAFGVPVWRLTYQHDGSLAAIALVLRRSLPSGHGWLYVPRGPLLRGEGVAIQRQLVALGREQRALFIRAEPHGELDSEWRKADHDVQPRHTVILDITAPEETLLTRMHAKTRYNIRLAERRGVRVRFSRTMDDLEVFLRLSRQVAGRGTFRFHPDAYYRTMITHLAGTELALAEYQGEALAANLLVSFGDTVTYVHGASSSSQRDLMAPHLLQWESIRRARRQGFAAYDFFGVASPNAGPQHPWAGVTRFKVGWGGRQVSYPGAYDLVLNSPGYWLYLAARRFRY